MSRLFYKADDIVHFVLILLTLICAIFYRSPELGSTRCGNGHQRCQVYYQNL